MGRESVCWKRSVGKINRSENVNLKIKEEVWRKEVKMEIGLGLSTREPIPFFGRNENVLRLTGVVNAYSLNVLKTTELHIFQMGEF